MKAVFATALLLAGLAHAQSSLLSCGTTVRLDAFVGQNIQGNLAANVTCSSLLAYYLDPTLNNSSNLNVNLRGDYTYTPPPFETAEIFTVTVRCFSNPLCSLQVVASVARVLTFAPTPAPPTPAPTPAQTECPHVYWYAVGRNTTLSDSLSNAAGQLPCTSGSSYTVTRQPNALIGSIVLTPIGDFRYTSLVNVDTWDDFGFNMFCQGILICKGNAYIMISNFIATGSPASNVPPSYTYSPGGTMSPSSPPNVVYTPMPGMTCTGTCNQDAWKAVPPPASTIWDTTPGVAPPRADLKSVTGIEASWVAGGLVIKAYGKIGDVAVRFPTFEDVTFAIGDLFTGVEQRQRVATTSVPFDTNCLDLQGTAGLGVDVWVWDSLLNRTGHVGSRYASGKNWYQKFGGKHIGCDTFQDACSYAPLLTPRRNQDPNTGGVWSIDINGCDVTWTGQFSFAALRAMRRADGTPVWTMSNSRVLQASIATEAVQPADWLMPTNGFLTNINRRNMILVLQPRIRATVDEANGKLFSIDAEYFEYLDPATGDRAFGLNILFYPHVDATATSSYASDRHVIGWKWATQSWSHPDKFQCPTCSGNQPTCNQPDNSDDSFMSDILYQGDCSNPLVNLVKGPSFSTADCPANQMHVMNRAGFSAPQYCRPSFQNITLRGIATGSAASANMSGSFSFEGTLRLGLLLDNGAQPTIDIELGMIVGFASVEGSYSGTSDVCRSGLYYPVLDPLGTSTPDVPYYLSGQDPTDLCTDRLDRTFGPQGWALVTFDVFEPKGQIPYTRIQVESVSVTFPGSPIIYLLRTDSSNQPTTALPPTENAVWWYRDYPFFNFRDLSARLPNQTFPVGDDVPKITGQDYAFAFTPGALNLNTEIMINAVFRVLPAPGSNGTVARVTYNRVLRIDPTLTALTRYGPPQLVTTVVTQSSNSSIWAMVAAGTLIVGLIFGFAFEVADANNPIVGGMAKTIRLLQMPLMLPVKIVKVGAKTARNVVGGKDQRKPTHVKRATKGGIPVRNQ